MRLANDFLEIEMNAIGSVDCVDSDVVRDPKIIVFVTELNGIRRYYVFRSEDEGRSAEEINKFSSRFQATEIKLEPG